MKFGYFDDANKEYVITSPRTPYPWINYLGTQDFSLISNTAGGYSFYKDARLRRITRYRYNNVPIDMGGRYFYINDNGTIWNPGWSPVKTELDEYQCRHGMGYTIITGKKNDLKAEVTFFVPQNYAGEVQQVVLTNEGSEEKTFSFFSFEEWCLWDAQDDCTNFQRNFSTGRVEVVGSTIYHKTEYRDRRDHFAFYTVNDEIDGYDTDRDSFIPDFTMASTTHRLLRLASQMIHLLMDGRLSLHTTRRSLLLQARQRLLYLYLDMLRCLLTRSSRQTARLSIR